MGIARGTIVDTFLYIILHLPSLSLCKEGHLDNACGTIAMIHAILNNKELLGLTDGSSPLEKFLEETSGMSYEERGRHLDNFR